MEATTAGKKKEKLVTVTLGVTDENGQSQTVEKQIKAGPTIVLELKVELEVPADSSLWFVKDGKRKPLVDHESHNVKEGDHFETLVKGGIS